MAAHRFWWAAICAFGSRLRAQGRRRWERGYGLVRRRELGLCWGGWACAGELGLGWGPGGAVVANYSL